MFSTLTKRNIVPDETINDQKLQEFLDTVGQFERILQDSGFVKLRRIKDDELTGNKHEVGLLEQYCFLQAKGAVPIVKDISFKDGISIGDDHCKLFALSDVEDMPSLCVHVSTTISTQPIRQSLALGLLHIWANYFHVITFTISTFLYRMFRRQSSNWRVNDFGCNHCLPIQEKIPLVEMRQTNF